MLATTPPRSGPLPIWMTTIFVVSTVQSRKPPRSYRRSAFQETPLKIVLLSLHFDDWTGDYEGNYKAQIDAHLERRSKPDLEVLWRLASVKATCGPSWEGSTVPKGLEILWILLLTALCISGVAHADNARAEAAAKAKTTATRKR